MNQGNLTRRYDFTLRLHEEMACIVYPAAISAEEQYRPNA